MTAPIPCPFGMYCDKGSMIQGVQCPNNTYQNLTQQHTCNSCPIGYRCDAVQTISFRCPVTYYCNVTGISRAEYDPFCISNPTDSSCPQICPKGYFCIQKSSNPTPCSKGFWNPIPKQFTCVICPIGYFCNDTGLYNISNLRCTPGYYCDKFGLQSATLLCPPGKYCLIGTDSINDIETDPNRNPAGFCPLGHFCLLGTRVSSFDPFDLNSPQPCPNGTYANVAGLSICIDCPGGFQCNGTGLITPQVCAKGTYRESASTVITCTKCPIGTLNEFEGRSALTDCLACPAGYICMSDGIGNKSDPSLVQVCIPKRYCPTGTHFQNIATFICPAGYACPEGLTSIFDAYNFPCPQGRFCSEGSGDLLSVYTQCTTIWKENPAKCPIGQLCARDYFCQLGTKTLSNSADALERCPTDTHSDPGSWSLLQCSAGTTFSTLSWNFTTEMLVTASSLKHTGRVLDAQFYSFVIEPYAYRKVSINASQFPLDPNFPITFQDFRIEFEICDKEFTLTGVDPKTGYPAVSCSTEFPNTYKNYLYINWQDDLAPISQLSVPFKILSGKFQSIFTKAKTVINNRIGKTPSQLQKLPDLSSVETIDFKIYGNSKIWVRFNLRIYNGFFTYASLRAQFFSSIIVSEQFLPLKFTFVAYLISEVYSSFEAPMNIFTPVNTFSTTISPSNINPTFFPHAIATLVTENIQDYYTYETGSFKDSNYKFWTAAGVASINTQYFPYVTDCDGVGAFISFSEFLSSKIYCTWPLVTVPIVIYQPGQLPKGQICKNTWTCRFSENLLSSPSITKRYWMKSNTFSNRFIYYISKNILENSEFAATYLAPNFAAGKTMEINSVVDPTDPAGTLINAFPSNVTLTIGYLQTPDDTQEVVLCTMIFSGFRTDNAFLNNPSYIFTVNFYPLTWIENLDNFAFPAYIYYIFMFMVCLTVFTFIFFLWVCYYRNSKVLPRPQLKVKVYFEYTSKALFGLFLGAMPIVGNILLCQNILATLADIFLSKIQGDYSIIGTETTEQIANKKTGRFALAMFTIGLYAIHKGISLLLPSVIVGDPLKPSKEKVLSEVRKKKSLLFYSTFVAIAFGSIFYQISKSQLIVGTVLTLFVVIYGQVAGNILGSAKAGFNDDLMVLPMKGAFSLIQLMLSLKIGLFTNYLIGYAIKIAQKIFQTQVVMPNRIAIEDMVAKIKKARGLKSAQSKNLVFSFYSGNDKNKKNLSGTTF